ncbi:Ca2+/H+ antiporter VCX1 [Handroanthus impetiginosus]|uniref:Vacuolar cation/proton exchanger n=1 Tax=Handroanthus impetiginosus TaxID=429701 RepID=A0A2G9I777_9LAMI|nr:Ca2+/H+ antiporter VCX1 [Handroanthus impetiginosus]
MLSGFTREVNSDNKPEEMILIMGSLAEKSTVDPEDLHLISPHPSDRSPLEITPPGSFFSSGSEKCGCKSILSSIFLSIKIALFSNKLNLLVPCGPVAILVDKLTDHHGWVFCLSLLGIIPLAERLGWVTEQLAFFTGPTVGSLLNVTFGNATELIISIHALRSNMIRVVQQSLLGSILSNMLLVLGCALFGGGIVHYKREQMFSKPSAAMNLGLLLMAVMGLLFPAVLHFTRTELHFGNSELALSRFSSCVMLVAYGAYIFFQLTSQKHLYTPINEEESSTPTDGSLDDDYPDTSKWESIVWLFIFTALISVLSEYVVNAMEGASIAMNIPKAFISVILLPVVGNAAEHASAIMFAVKDKLDIALGIAIGSSTQIAMFVVCIEQVKMHSNS